MQNSSQHRLATISLWIAACLVSLALQSCSEQDAKAFRNLFPLQNELKSKYQAEAVELTLENSHILDITLKNSPSSALGLDELKFRGRAVPL